MPYVFRGKTCMSGPDYSAGEITEPYDAEITFKLL